METQIFKKKEIANVFSTPPDQGNLLSEKESQTLAVMYSALFMAEIAAIETLQFCDLIQKSKHYKNDRVRQRISTLKLRILEFENRSFKSKKNEMRNKYLELAQEFGLDKFILEQTIINTLHYEFIEEYEMAKQFLVSGLLMSLASLSIEDGNCGKILNHLGLDGPNTGITAIRKLTCDIASLCKIPFPKDTTQISEAVKVLDLHYLQNQDLLIRIIELNNIKVHFLNQNN